MRLLGIAAILLLAQAREGVISGRVTSDTGTVLPNMQVSIMRAKYNEAGLRRLEVIDSVRTDDRGQFRVFGLQPRQYYLAAGSNAASSLPSPEQLAGEIGAAFSGTAVSRYAWTYYSGTQDASQALPLDIRAGQETAVTLVLPKVRTFQIRGKVIDGKTGQPPPSESRIAFFLMHVDSVLINPILSADVRRSQRPYSGDGSFLHAAVEPGEYWVIATMRTPVVPDVPLPATTSYARTRVRVMSSDVEGIVLVFDPLSTISARVTVDTPSPIPSTIFITLRPPINALDQFLGPEVWPPTPMTPDGTFDFENVAPGKYYLRVKGLPPEFYVKEARFDQTDVLAEGLEMRPGPSAFLNIVLSSKAGRIQGRVVDAKKDTVPQAVVVLVPSDRPERTDLYKNVTSSPSGDFSFDGVTPGAYRVFAWQSLEPFDWFDPKLIRSEAKPVEVRVEEASRQSVDVPVYSSLDR